MKKAYEQIQWQIWALLPSFANKAVDLSEAAAAAKVWKPFCQQVLDAIRHSDPCRVNAMAALRRILCPQTAARMSRNEFAKNFITSPKALFGTLQLLV